jgi:hypothetical protein
VAHDLHPVSFQKGIDEHGADNDAADHDLLEK